MRVGLLLRLPAAVIPPRKRGLKISYLLIYDERLDDHDHEDNTRGPPQVDLRTRVTNVPNSTHVRTGDFLRYGHGVTIKHAAKNKKWQYELWGTPQYLGTGAQSHRPVSRIKESTFFCGTLAVALLESDKIAGTRYHSKPTKTPIICK